MISIPLYDASLSIFMLETTKTEKESSNIYSRRWSKNDSSRTQTWVKTSGMSSAMSEVNEESNLHQLNLAPIL